jgi:excisionase family DNA binding protein
MLITIDEAAALLRVSARTVRRQAVNGELDARRVGRQIRLPIEQFSDFIDVAKVKGEIERRAKRLGVNTPVPAGKPNPTPEAVD